MTARASCAIFVLIFCASCSDPLKPDPRFPTAEKMRGDALAAAKKEGKSVLLVFSSKGENWCELLDQFHADPEVWKVLGKYFVLCRVDIRDTPGGMQMFSDYGFAPYAPAFAMQSPNGETLANSGEGEKNVGFPNNDEQVERYIAATKTACPQISDEEIAVLRSKLEQMRQPE
jgi:hypothetical protein